MPTACSLELRARAAPLGARAWTDALSRVYFSATAPGLRALTISVTDAAVGGALPATARLPAASVATLALRVNAPARAPALSALPGRPLWVLSDATYGARVVNGALVCRDAADPSAALAFFVTGGERAAYVGHSGGHQWCTARAWGLCGHSIDSLDARTLRGGAVRRL